MSGAYYKLPIDFDALKQRKDLAQMPLEASIRQHLFVLITTSLGECKFDHTYGCELWEMDFDLLKSDNELKQFIYDSVFQSVKTHEKRLFLQNIDLSISQESFGNRRESRVKKKIVLSLKGLIKETNRELIYTTSFYVGPLSY
uniref:GPW/gp25 family protein n=1 Tax=Ornithobacterium rhinotracheale TaxID=28251 RepID=UPI0039A52C12